MTHDHIEVDMDSVSTPSGLATMTVIICTGTYLDVWEDCNVLNIAAPLHLTPGPWCPRNVSLYVLHKLQVYIE